MKIKRAPLIFHNVLESKMKSKPEDWTASLQEFRNEILKHGLYATGPIMYQIPHFDDLSEDELIEYRFYIPVNDKIYIQENDTYKFHESLQFEDGLVLRHSDLDENIEGSYDIIRACAWENQYVLKEPFYNIYLDVFGGGIIDIYAPITEEATDD